MNLRAWQCSVVASLVFMAAACGGGGTTNFNNVVVTVAPANGTVVANGQLALQASVAGLPAGDNSPALTWAILELQTNGASGSQCNWLGSNPPIGPCSDGTIQGADAPSATSVIYHAPSTTGTFHVIAQFSVASNPPVSKSATSTVTVSP